MVGDRRIKCQVSACSGRYPGDHASNCGSSASLSTSSLCDHHRQVICSSLSFSGSSLWRILLALIFGSALSCLPKLNENKVNSSWDNAKLSKFDKFLSISGKGKNSYFLIMLGTETRTVAHLRPQFSVSLKTSGFPDLNPWSVGREK